MENKLIPYQATQCIKADSVVVFAPHPDDEVFGCGGAILRHVAAGVTVQVVIVSDGAYGAEEEKKSRVIAEREAESRKAAAILGYGEPEFWRLPDRGVIYGEALIQRIMYKIQLTAANLIYAPSLLEMHPDHRALAMCVIEAVRRAPSKPQLSLYEIGVPLHPNLLLDISDLTERKKIAMECFESQNKQQRYDLDIAALNRYRTYSLPTEVTAAEAYILVSAEELISDPFKLFQSEHQRHRALGLALDNTDIPLVSVIIRSMDRPTLSEALDSVALQTYPNIEVVVVNAKGAGHSLLGDWCGHFPLRMEFAADGSTLTRPQAANLGLEKAKGQWLIFLDDDDLFDPDHIAGLKQALRLHPQVKAAYADVRVEDAEGHVTAIFNAPYDQRRLLASNFIPINALLFSRSLIGEAGARFDENLEVYEDWDFWLQLSYRTSFLHINKISAAYRALGNSGVCLIANKNIQRQGYELVYDKWRLLWTGKDIDRLVQYLFEQERKLVERDEQQIANLNQAVADRDGQIANLNQTVAERDGQIASFNQAVAERDGQIASLNQALAERDGQIASLNQALAERDGQIASFTTEIDMIKSSRSWKFLRKVARLKNLLVNR